MRPSSSEPLKILKLDGPPVVFGNLGELGKVRMRRLDAAEAFALFVSGQSLYRHGDGLFAPAKALDLVTTRKEIRCNLPHGF